jgi:hypothetical protein
MTATTHHPITKFQINRIMQNCAYQVDTKNEWVQWVTGDVSRTSLKSITHDEAIKILHAQTGTLPVETLPVETLHCNVSTNNENYALFDKNNPRHKLILSLCRQANWTVKNEKYGEVADLQRLDSWLKSERSPVNKPLKKMDAKEIERIIGALSGIIKKLYK